MLEITGDFVLRRGDEVASYQLAVAVDDAEMGISEVVRGDDLLPSTARQVLLGRLIFGANWTAPTYCHLPLVSGPDGERLAKRQQRLYVGTTIRELRAMGVPAAEISGEIACGLGWVPRGDRITSSELPAVARANAHAVSTHHWVVPIQWIHARTT